MTGTPCEFVDRRARDALLVFDAAAFGCGSLLEIAGSQTVT
ncbi:hypothetical protein [uncultured Jannaschia sp.]|nr:hypothetical protein [uncultured Jannaschia sp.]